MATEDIGNETERLKIQTLLEDYKSKDQFNQNAYRLVIQTTGIGLATFTGLLAYLSTARPEIHEVVFWLLPLTFVIPYSLVYQLFYTMIFNGYYLRQIEEFISRTVGIDFFPITTPIPGACGASAQDR